MSRRLVLLLICGLIGSGLMTLAREPSPDQVRQWREEAKARHVEAHVRTVRIALADLEADRPEAFAALPEALRDSLPWWVGRKPAAEWSQEVRAYVLDRFRALADNPGQMRVDVEALREWLAEPDPLAGTSIEFSLLAGYSLADGHRDHGVFFSIPGGSGYDLLSFDRFLQSLTAEQRRQLLHWQSRPAHVAHERGLPLAGLTADQRAMVLRLAGEPSRQSMEEIAAEPDAVVRTRFHLKIYVRRGGGQPPAGFYEVNI